MGNKLNLGGHVINGTQQNNRSNEDRPFAQIWLNIGFSFTEPETGETIFISLPMGIPVDTMRPKEVSGSHRSMNRKLVQAKNQLLEQLQLAAASMKSGEEYVLDDLKVQIRHVTQNEEPARNDNPLLGALSSLSFAKRKAA